MKTELKPCPWCGSKNLEIHDCSKTSHGWFVRCLDRHSEGGFHDTLCHYGTKEEAITAWNHRPQIDKAVEMLEVLRLNHRYQLEVVHGLIEDLDAVIKELKG